MSHSIDDVRKSALDKIQQAEKHFRMAILGAAVFEALFLLTMLMTADLKDRTHLLLLISTVGAYTLVVLGLVVLGAHVNRAVLRVLRSVETLVGER